MAAELKGSLRVEVSEDKLRAFLVFSPDPGGPVVSIETIKRQYSENQIRPGTDSPAPEALLKALDESKEQEPKVLAVKGLFPQPPEEEVCQWMENPIPESLAEVSGALFSGAGGPVIEKIIIDKVPVVKKVVKKSRLPFGKRKTEDVKVMEKRERREPVLVDPTVVGRGYVKAGSVIAECSSPKPGKPGKDVFGMPLAAPSLDGSEVMAGLNVTKERGLITADVQGFYRRGINWVDIIPFSPHNYSLSLSGDKSTCFLEFKAGHPEAPIPDPGVILEKAKEIGAHSETLLDAVPLEVQMMKAAHAGKSRVRISLNASADSEIRIDVSEDRLKAELYLRKGRGQGRPLVLRDVGTAIKGSDLKGLNLPQIQKDLVDYYRSDRQSLEHYVLAEGDPPESPSSPELTLDIPFLEGREKSDLWHRLQGYVESNIPEGWSAGEPQEMGRVQGGQVIGCVTPGNPGKPGRDVYGLEVPGTELPGLNHSLYGSIRYEKECFVAEADGYLLFNRDDDEISFWAIPSEDGSLEIVVSEDAMEAKLYITPESGAGNGITEEKLKEAIEESGVQVSVEPEVLTQALETSEGGDPVHGVVIARGEKPVAGGSRVPVFLIKPSSDEAVHIVNGGRADYKNRMESCEVEAGVVLVEIPPAIHLPKAGRDVMGVEIAPPSSADPELRAGKHVRREETDDGTVRFIAEMGGELIFNDPVLEINNVRSIQGSVDMKTGNVKFSGAVKVSGSVTSGFGVMAGDSLLIGEGVEKSLVSCSGKIKIGQGIRGGGKGVVRSGADISAGFAEQAILLSVNDITVEKSCLLCRVQCNGKLVLSSDKGNLVGGEINVRHGVEAMNIGSESGVKTSIAFGQDFLIQDQIKTEERAIEQLKQKVPQIDAMMKKAEETARGDQLNVLRQQKIKVMKVMEKRTIRLFNLREKSELHHESEIRVRGSIFPGVELKSHGRTYEVMQKKSQVVFFFDKENGHIVDKPLK